MARPALAGLTLSAAQIAQIPGYIEEASALVCGYLGHTFAGTDDDPVPGAATIVCARVVARALTTSPTDPNLSESTNTRGMGSFSATTTAHLAQDVLGGGVWLTRQDKMALDSIGGAYSRMTCVPLYPFDPCPPAPPNWWQMTPAPGSGNP